MSRISLSRRHFLLGAAAAATTTAMPAWAITGQAGVWAAARAVVARGDLGTVLYAQGAQGSGLAFAESLAPLVSVLGLTMPTKVSSAGNLPAAGVMTLEYGGSLRVVLTTAMAPMGRAHAFIRGTEGLLEITDDAVVLTADDGRTERVAVAPAPFSDGAAFDRARRAVDLGMSQAR